MSKHVATIALQEDDNGGVSATVMVNGRSVHIAPMRTVGGALVLAANAILEERAREDVSALPDYSGTGEHP